MASRNTQAVWRSAVLILLVSLLAACSSFKTTDLSQLDHLPAESRAQEVPFYPQQENYCGPAALAGVLNWTGLEVTQEEVAKQVYTPGADGTFRQDMISAARRHGRLAVPLRNFAKLLEEVSVGTPVVVFQNLGLSWWNKWHFAVMTGYDLGKENVWLNSGSEENRLVGMKLFERTWRRGESWALVVLPPDRLPVTADVFDVMQAAAGLERAGRLQAAATAYRTVSYRWPDHWLAFLGLGNVNYRLSLYPQSIAAYRRAVALKPDAAEAWNNLAYALKAQGETAQAIEAAMQAVKYDRSPSHVATLREMQGVM